jgi:Kef-type K+ transport system membrane component KefB
MGSRLDLNVFRSKEVVFIAVIISFLAVISKTVGCSLAVINEGWKNALKVGVGMTPRGEVALIVALIGLQLNVISQRAYAVVIFMTAVTTMLPPPFLRVLFSEDTPQANTTESEEQVEEAAERVVPGDIG